MISEFIQVFNRRSRYIALSVLVFVIVLSINYFDHIAHQDAPLIMYALDAPKEVRVEPVSKSTKSSVDILIGRGEQLVTKKFVSNFNIIKKVTPLSSSINIRPAEGEPLLNTQVGLRASVKLKESDSLKNIHVLFHCQDKQGKKSIGVFSNKSLSIDGDIVSFDLEKFGTYQLVNLTSSLESNLTKDSTIPIFTSAEGKHSIIYSSWAE